MNPVSIVVPGVTGRMGRLIAEEALNDRRHTLVGATSRADGPHAGKDLGDILRRGHIGIDAHGKLAQALAAVDPKNRPVVIDFTLPDLIVAHTLAAAHAKTPILVGTTGLDDEAEEVLDKAAEEIAVLVAANTSLGANVLAHLAAETARALANAGVDVDTELVELHHRRKRDAPSGTALELARRIADSTGRPLDDRIVNGRSGGALRNAGEIGVHAVRGGTVPGEHTVYFFLEDERVELTHRVTDRRIFATGALAGARFLATAPPGRYSMADVLTLGGSA